MAQIGLTLTAVFWAAFIIITFYSRGGEIGAVVMLALVIVVFPLIAAAFSPRYKKHELIRKQQQLDKQRRFRDSILKTKIIDTSHTVTQTVTPKTGSAIGRAIVGDFVAGPVGAIVGSATAKEKVVTHESHKTTFMVFCTNGTREHVTVENGTDLYNLYMEKLEVD